MPVVTLTYASWSLRAGILLGGLISSAAALGQTYSVLYNFGAGGPADAIYPDGNLLLDAQGDIVGTSSLGGAHGDGTIYQLTQGGTITIRHSFANPDKNPTGGLIADPSGNLYGTTMGGRGEQDHGTVFALEPSGVERVEEFGSPGPIYPTGGLVFYGTGAVAGTTQEGGADLVGAVYTVNAAGAVTTLYSFTGDADGAYPASGSLAIDAHHNLYGVVGEGFGSYADNTGSAYRVSPTGIETKLYMFPYSGDPTLCQFPNGGLILDKAGNLYGTTTMGGPNQGGCIYKITPNGTFVVLYSLTEGVYPYANPNLQGGLALDAAGNLYGTTGTGGANKSGSVFELNTSGVLTTLYSFPGEPGSGNGPLSGVTVDAAGNIYGAASGGLYQDGVIFKITQ